MGACVSKFCSTPQPDTDPSLVDQEPPPLGADSSLPEVMDKLVISKSPPPTTSFLSDTSKSDIISTSSSSSAAGSSSSSSSSSSSLTSTSASSPSSLSSSLPLPSSTGKTVVYPRIKHHGHGAALKPKHGGGPPGQGRRPPPVSKSPGGPSPQSFFPRSDQSSPGKRARSSSPTIRSSRKSSNSTSVINSISLSTFQRSRSVDMQIRQRRQQQVKSPTSAVPNEVAAKKVYARPSSFTSPPRSSSNRRQSSSYGKETSVHHIHDVGHSPASDSRNEDALKFGSAFVEDIDNPLISMDCFIFL